MLFLAAGEQQLHSFGQFPLREEFGQPEQGRNPAGVVVGTRGARYGVAVGGHEDDPPVEKAVFSLPGPQVAAADLVGASFQPSLCSTSGSRAAIQRLIPLATDGQVRNGWAS